MMADLGKLAIKLGTKGPFKTAATPRMVKVLLGGVFIKTTNAVFVWEHPYYPQFYIPIDDIKATKGLTIKPGQDLHSEDGTKIATYWNLTAGPKSTDRVIAFASNLSGPAAALQNLAKIDFASVDQWFEEDTPIFVHPKDPYKRIDILQSQRHLRISLHGSVIAETHTAMHLYETDLPCRYYMPLTAVDQSVLRRSETRSQCPYKGESEYYHVEVGGRLVEDVFWYYATPTLESARVAGLVCAYNEKVDIELDGVKLERPKTHFA